MLQQELQKVRKFKQSCSLLKLSSVGSVTIYPQISLMYSSLGPSSPAKSAA